MSHESAIIIGAGPAGLTAAYQLLRQQQRMILPIVLEQSGQVGGLARTELYQGYRFDIGGHRFYTKLPEVESLWHEVLQEDFLKVARLSRIYYRGRFFNYPLNFFNALSNLGGWESLRVLFSYLKARLFPSRREETFEEWVRNRFGERLYRIFFQTYTEKIWGIPCHQIQAEWAAQRIKGLSLISAVTDALFHRSQAKSLINQFHYPTLGPGMMWEHFQRVIEQAGGRILLNSETIRFHHQNQLVRAVTMRSGEQETRIAADHFISSMPITELIARLDPPPPQTVIDAAAKLSYRDFLIVALVVDRAELFPDQWIYIHSDNVQVGRIQNFKNWSREMVPNQQQTCLGLEYFCNQGDALWNRADSDLIELAKQELTRLGLVSAQEISAGRVVRQLKAYPVYNAGYQDQLQVLKEYLRGFKNLQTIGRNGMHHYNNQDHSMLTGLLAVGNILGESHDLWNVNTERSYYEEFETSQAQQVTISTKQ